MTQKLKELEVYASILKGLQERWRPHPGQINVGRALIQDGVRDIFVQAGRNWGKTNLVSYLLWRWALMNPGSENYYFAPYMKQAREIIWAPRVIQNFGPREWVQGDPNNTEMRITFKNGSFIKADGSDNVESYRGVKPKGLIIFDEFKDFREEFYEAFDPNRAAHNAPLIIIGTPPGRESQFTKVREAYKADPNKRYFHGPTSQNPHISKDWLANKKAELEARGEEDVWQREYEALDVAHSQTKLFPMLKREHIVAHETVLQRIKRDRKRLEWVLWCDPAAASTFAVLFAAHNPYTKELFLLDEIYETEQQLLTVNQIGQRIKAKKEEIEDRYEWRQGYDEAATWFANEMLDNFSEHYEPSNKSANQKDVGLTLIKDMLLKNKLIISDRCVKTYWEMDNYYKDGTGKIPKVFDHLIDNLRYILAALYYSLSEQDAPQEPKLGPPTKIEDDFPKLKGLI
jgi:hypothetical protein